MRRKSATIKQRITPCECCDYPISQRHHLLQVGIYGENKYTKQLCANCHELFHVLWNTLDNNGEINTNKIKDYNIPKGCKHMTRSMDVLLHILNWSMSDNGRSSAKSFDNKYMYINSLVCELKQLLGE